MRVTDSPPGDANAVTANAVTALGVTGTTGLTDPAERSTPRRGAEFPAARGRTGRYRNGTVIPGSAVPPSGGARSPAGDVGPAG
ncbi:hypothetical protein Acsp04_11400 [Actinomadura sp. NBRC 104425]|nr:hypothetical protein Acsp04_11400 [Actinomadura sp. NBRC 104425]